MSEKFSDMAEEAKQFYARSGSWGNNTTIPDDEKRRIAYSEPDSPDLLEARLKYRAEMEQHDEYVRLGLAPDHRYHDSWMQYEGIDIQKLCQVIKPWDQPFSEQRRWRENSRLSKSARNMQKFLEKE